MKRALQIAIVMLLVTCVARDAAAARILEICDVRGVRENQLIGYGLVVGLAQTGDTGQSRFTLQSTAAMLRRLGATIDPSMIQTRNAAAVMVTATLPPGAQPGTRIDVVVSSMGNARSLAGGTLLQTPLYGADRRVYAVAQGPMLVGGFGASGRSGSSVQVNHLTAGRVPEGAIVERRVPGAGLSAEGPLTLTLREPSFITARRIEEAIDAALGADAARAVDAATVEVTVPESYGEDRVRLLAEVQVLEVQPESRARVVVDERTGTVVVGAGVRLRQAAIAQGGLSIEITESQQVSQPGVYSGGTTAVVPDSQIQARAAGGTLHLVPDAASLSDIVAALDALGASPRDLITIFQGLRSAGALDAGIEVQ